MPTPTTDLGQLLSGVPTGPDDALGPSTHPLALFPVRLETRLFRAPPAMELRIRVYPDKIHLDAHDPALTADELTAGQRYWRAEWLAGPEQAGVQRAWQVLADRFGASRAAWIARSLTPLNPADRPHGDPRFPDLGPPATGSRVPVVRLLPDRWVATAFVRGAVVGVATGRNVVPSLAVGPDLTAPVTLADDQPAIDDGMRWMVDFEAAEQVGMALRLPVPLPGVVDLLLVTGMSPAERSADLAAQMDAHHFTDGLSFLAPGTPTNNTTGGRTPYCSPDPLQGSSFAAEVRSGPSVPGSCAERARWAFGVDVFDRLRGATDTDPAVAAAMTTALWPATWGYFLAQMVGFDGSGMTAAGRDWLRDHALAHLRPGGPLPVLRAGSQPYGVLPVTPLDGWTPRSADDPAVHLRDVLVGLRERVWRPAAARVPRVGATDDAGADLADVLRAGPLSAGFAVRGLMGQHLLQHLRALVTLDRDPAAYWAQLLAMTDAVVGAVGWGTGSAITRMVHEEVAHPVQAPLVGPDPAAAVAELLATSDLDALAARATSSGESLLAVLLRHALLREHTEAAARMLATPFAPLEQLLRDAELVDLVPGQPPAPTWSRLLDTVLPGTATTVRDRLTQTPDSRLVEHRAALRVLAQAGPGALARELVGALDTASHRLDAWVTSLATRRLAEQRVAAPNGLLVGGYGWLEGLRPSPGGRPVDPLPGEPGPLSSPADDAGFIHAPSLNQASAAALLRNAHLAHGGTPDSPFAIDLSSGRIRLVRQLFDGVRQGQPLGALLGYTVERRLHEAGLDDLVDPLRTLAPLPGAATPTGVRRLVVDGLALAQLWRSDPGRVLSSLAPNDPRRRPATRILDAVEDAVDAASDAVQAESAFQMVRGNLSRAAASLETISSGQAPPPDLGFLRTPRTGVSVTHRTAMLFSTDVTDDTGVTAGWAATSPRAQADPVLNAWAGRLLGPADGMSVRVEMLDRTGAVTGTLHVPLAALELTPIDLVWITAGGEHLPAELVQRVLDAARQGPGASGDATELRVDASRQGSGRSVADLVEVAARAQRLLAGARPLDGADLQPPHADPVRGLDLTEFAGRAEAAQAALAAARGRLESALAAAAASVPAGADLRAAMLAVAAFGVDGAVPVAGGVPTVQAQALLAEVDRRVRAVTLPDPATPPGPEDPADSVLARFRAVFGTGFLALPRFTASTAADLSGSLADFAALYGEDPLAAYTWLLRMERVRAPLARFSRPLREAEALGNPERLDLAIAQVPHVPNQRWTGLPLAGDVRPADGAVSLILQSVPKALDGALCGVLVDEWTELIPSATETTGIAFQSDQPDSAAPQAILLAVPPVLGRPWTVGSLNRVLIETLDLARLRAVSPADLGDAGHFLPATYLAFNLAGDAVSTDLNPLTG